MTYHVAFWNLENLYAPEDHAAREPWIAKKMGYELRGWSQEFFERKVANLGEVSSGIGDGAGPDQLGVCEVENRFALDTLVAALNAGLADRDYGVVHADHTLDHRGIDTGFVYDRNRLSVDPDSFFSHFVMRRTGTRDISQATFRTVGGRALVALCNHWPARSGNDVIESSGFRATAGETLAYWHERIREEVGEDTAIIAIGDFNDDPFDNSIRYNASAWRERGDVERSRSARFYNLAWTYHRQQVTDHSGKARQIYGTLYYRNNGNLFDQILVNRSLLTGEGGLLVREETARIEAPAPMVDHRVNYGPMRFGLPKGKASNVNTNGYSDHFPVSVVIDEAD